MSSLEIEFFDYTAESGHKILVAICYQFIVLFASIKDCDENREDDQYYPEYD